MTRYLLSLLLLSCVLSLAPDHTLFADETSEDIDDKDARRCINVRTLKRTEVIDDNHILFYMSGNTVYINRLPRACTGLSRERRFSYTTSSRSLCSFDSIRVLSDLGGSIFEGRFCRLGTFVPTSIEDVEDAKERALEPPPIIVPAGAEVEDVIEEADDSAD